MSFHITNLGSAGESLKKYADYDGYIPEEGDSSEDFTYPGCDEEDYLCNEGWEDFVKEAVEATKEAEKAIEKWRIDN